MGINKNNSILLLGIHWRLVGKFFPSLVFLVPVSIVGFLSPGVFEHVETVNYFAEFVYKRKDIQDGERVTLREAIWVQKEVVGAACRCSEEEVPLVVL